MGNTTQLDHLEVHVKDVSAYCDFLVKIFQGGRYKVISPSGTSMYKNDAGLCIEIKKTEDFKLNNQSGFCNPCLRMNNAQPFIEQTLGFEITKFTNNPDGKCYFFNDHEGIQWHIKDYIVEDEYVGW